MSLGKILLYQPIISLLIFFYRVLGNLGWSIILSIVLIRLILLPISSPSLKATMKMQKLAPALAKLKKKYANDKQKLAKAQMDLYKTHKINPAAGCLPQIFQIVIIFVLYRVFNDILLTPDSAQVIEKINSAVYSFLRLPSETVLSSRFLYLDLTKPDLIKIAGRSIPGPFLLLSVAAQYLTARLMMPKVKKEAKMAKKTETPTDDMASMMQKQSLYIFPFMTLLFGFNFPSGLIVSWTTLSLVNLGQQWWLKKGEKN
ncbi:YidC/Oxa1 family membrane protein insertase [Candidatus Shapirobacteria bacterium]|nr:YidC/Oxa1 family membrane protein insertase [Candidatus Shapirobacteria bacterium]